MAASDKPNELRLVRVYDASVEQVWDAWTDPEQVGKWWGPRGFTLTSHSKDFRPGGIWHYTMYGPDGTDYPNKTVYLKIEEHQKLVYDHGGYDDRPPLFRVTVLFNEIDGKTTMDMTMTLPTAEAAQDIAKYIKQAGGNATWDRLAEHLAHRREGKQQFVIHRTFDAPIDVVFNMWTSPEYLTKWQPPVGFEMQLLRTEIRSGGKTFFRMTNHADATFYARWEYLEVEKPRRIVYLQQFCDEDEAICRPAMVPVWPETLLTVVEFAQEGTQQTRVTVIAEPAGSFTQEELAAFIAERPGMMMGWSGSFDKLDSLLGEA